MFLSHSFECTHLLSNDDDEVFGGLSNSTSLNNLATRKDATRIPQNINTYVCETSKRNETATKQSYEAVRTGNASISK